MRDNLIRDSLVRLVGVLGMDVVERTSYRRVFPHPLDRDNTRKLPSSCRTVGIGEFLGRAERLLWRKQTFELASARRRRI